MSKKANHQITYAEPAERPPLISQITQHTMTTPNTNIPEGFRINAQGNLIHESNIKEIDLARDELVIEHITKAMELGKQVAAFKKEVLESIQAFTELSAEKYGAKIGGKKGNITLTSFDGRYQILRCIADNISFDERLQAAKSLIDECFQDWTKDARSELQTLIHSAFETDKKGNLATHKILALRSIKIEDPKWVRAMEAISDAITVSSTKTYVRFYERTDSGQYLQISLDPTEL